jgi:uncharacterized protein
MLAQMRVAGELLGRYALSKAAGLTFGTMRDLYTALGYKKVLTPQDYRLRYYRNAVAARIVEAFPTGTWRGTGGELIELENPDRTTGFEKAWISLSTRLNIWSTFKRADILAGLGTYSVILLGGPGKLQEPLPMNMRPEDLYFMTAFAQDDATIYEFEDNAGDPRFGLPRYYRIKRLNPNRRGESTVVHWSRCIHVADNLLDDRVHGQPRLMRVWNLLDDLEKVTGGGSEAFWRRAHQGYQFDMDPEIEMADGEEEELEKEVEAFTHDFTREIKTRGVKINPLGSDVAMFDRNVEAIISQMSAGTGIPKRILMGSERGQLASEQDRVNWAERVQDRRNDFGSPVVWRPTADRFIKHGILPEPRRGPVEYDAIWPAVYDMSTDEKARVGVRYAEVNQKFGGIVVTENEIRDRAFGWAPLPESVVKENRENVKNKNAPKLDKSQVSRQDEIGKAGENSPAKP